MGQKYYDFNAMISQQKAHTKTTNLTCWIVPYWWTKHFLNTSYVPGNAIVKYRESDRWAHLIGAVLVLMVNQIISLMVDNNSRVV